MTRHVERGLARVVPSQQWTKILVVVALLVVTCMAGWEVQMRRLGLRAGDLDDGRPYWTVERRKIDSGPSEQVAIIGDSRLLFDTDLATWQAITGFRPIQLALPGTGAGAFLHDLARDEHFKGLAVVGVAPLLFFREGKGFMGDVLDYQRIESPSQRVSHRIDVFLQRHFAFLDQSYALFPLLERRKWPEREGVDGPYFGEVWKISEQREDRQTMLWDRIETDEYLREHARAVWLRRKGKPFEDAVIQARIDAARADTEIIRARGGEVVFVRAPSAPPLLTVEEQSAARARAWDPLLRETSSFGVYFADYPEMQGLEIPEFSHLSRSSALRFTRAYVLTLVDHVPWLKARAHPAGADPAPP
jgi:hypothetical protein